ncbi:MAG: SIR2 family protein [Rhodobacter sp.]|nr:SIR2 family protein [Rhodobacter sp.]
MTEEKRAEKDHYFRRVREHLRYWPHTLHQIDDTLDIGLIEGKGRQIVYQALNARNLTAFVGSGLSVAYGRMSWAEWKDEHLRIVERNAEAFLKLTAASLDQLGAVYQVIDYKNPASPAAKRIEQKHRHAMWRWIGSMQMAVLAAQHHVERLHETFQRCKAKGEGFVGGDGATVLFDVANQLHDAVESHARIFLGEGNELATKNRLHPKLWPGAHLSENPGSVPESAKEVLQAIKGETKLEETYKSFAAAQADFHAAMNRPLARDTIEAQSKRILASECGHALSILRAGLLRGKPTTDPAIHHYEALESLLPFPELQDLKRAFPSLRDDPNKYQVLAPFLRRSFGALRKIVRLPTGWDRIKEVLDAEFEPAAVLIEPDRFLSPTLRFLVGAHMCLHSRPQDWMLVSANMLNPAAFPKLERKHFTSRRSIIDEGLDPLERIIGGLGIRKFITLNYDFEIERAFLDRGFRRFPRHDPAVARHPPSLPGPTDFPADAVGSLLRDQTFQRERASDLVRFNIGDPRDEASVFHLHGRATREDRMVITERDYMDLYMMEDAHRETVHDGITMAFSGSPILFLGLGMTEADLLRPLRQFMANRDRTLGFSSVALMPAFRSLEERTKFATSVYQRYGVHTVYYGGGLVKVETDEGKPGDDGQRSLDWLYRVTQLIEGLREHVVGIEDKLEKANDDFVLAESPLADLMKKLGAVGSDLEGYPDVYDTADTGKRSRPSALMVLLGTRNIGLDEETGTSSWVVPAQIESGECSIQLCTFTPVRSRPENEQSRHFDKETHVAADKYLGFPVKLLSQIFLLLVNRKDPWKTGDGGELAALRLMLDGLKGAIMTGALNAALEGLQRGWQVWWQKWQDSPPHRLARFEHVTFDHSDLPVLFMRHRVDNVLGPTREEWANPITGPITVVEGQSGATLDKTQSTGLRSFDTFIAAIASNHTQVVAKPDQGRVMFTILAHRGLGKGTFLSAFSSARGLTLYEQALWGQQSASAYTKRDRGAFLLSSVFINFSFSTEIASTLDMLLDVLIDAAAVLRCNGGQGCVELRKKLRQLQLRRDSSPLEPYSDHVKSYDKRYIDTRRGPILDRLANLPRQEALREAMRTFAQVGKDCKSSDGQPRVLICLSSMDVLYDNHNRFKNREIEACMEWLTGPEIANLPVDLVFLSSESGLGPPFDARDEKTGEALWRIRLDRKGLSPESDTYIRQRLEGGRLRLDADGTEAAEQAAILIGGDTPKTAAPKGTALTRSRTNFIHVVRPFSAVELLLDNFMILATGLWLDQNKVKTKEKHWKVFSDGVKEGLKKSDGQTNELWEREKLPSSDELREVRGFVWKAVKSKMGGKVWDFSQEINDRRRGPPSGTAGEAAQDARSELRAIRHHLRENRFLMTILLAAAQNGIVLASDPKQGAREARRFIDATIDRARNASADEVEEVVVRAVLESYQSRHQIGDPDRDSELHGLVLRHLGVIGAPVQVDVLVRLPEFRDYFDRLGVDLPTSRSRFLARALTVMAHRGLVFRLTPHPRQVVLEQKTNKDKDWPVSEKHRYVLHRVVQRHVLARLQVGTRDAIAAGSFAPSLYAAMPSPGDGLSTEGYNFIRALIVGLSQYPDIPRGDDRLRPWLFTTDQPNIRIQALRLALSLARSTLSLPVFTALDGQAGVLLGQSKRGFLDTYKVRLRWLIRFAWETIHQESVLKESDLKESDPNKRHSHDIKPENAEEFPHLNALYRDEIVWLYNELGVISLAQGNLTEALGFLRLGREINERIEGTARRGPIGDRLAMNYAAVQIERGRLETAERLLRRLRSDAKKESLEALVADGYLCQIDALRGRRKGLPDRFANVVAGLERRGEARAEALFLLHHARAVYRESPKDGLRLIERAHAVASAGGHEDIRNRVELSRVAIERRTPEEGQGTESDWSRRLIAVESYGRRMGIWSLQVDALRLRAERLLEFGESASAGQLLVRAMAIAQRNRMMLRLNGAMTLYAQALLLRGETLAAREMAQDSLKLARRLRYSLEETRSSDLLTRIQSQIDINAVKQSRIAI